MKSIEEQFQIGDPVVYLPEGVRAIVTGYVWSRDLVAPTIGAYELSCGIHAGRDQLQRIESDNVEFDEVVSSIRKGARRTDHRFHP